MSEEVGALAQDVAKTLVDAAATEAWSYLKPRFLDFAGRHAKQVAETEARIEQAEPGSEAASQVKAQETARWAVRMEDLLGGDEQAAAAAREFVRTGGNLAVSQGPWTYVSGGGNAATITAGSHSTIVNNQRKVSNRFSLPVIGPLLRTSVAHPLAAVLAVVVIGGISTAVAVDPSHPATSTPGSSATSATGSTTGSGGPAFTGTLAPGFSEKSVWQSRIIWSDSSTATTDPAVAEVSTGDQNAALMSLQAADGLVQVLGDTVVVPQFTAGGVVSGATTTLQFRDTATGKIKFARQLPAGTFGSMSTDTVNGNPVLVVRYTSTAASDEAANNGSPVKVTTVFNADGTVVWTSAGTPVSDASAASSGVDTDDNNYPAFYGGYVVRYNGSSSSDTSAESFDVLNTSGTVVLHVPRIADSSEDVNNVTIAGGYAIVAYSDYFTHADEMNIHVHFTAYNLVTRAVVGSFQEPGDSALGEGGTLLAASGRKLLVSWLGDSSSSFSESPTDLAVFDTGTGRLSTPVPLPVSSLGTVASGTFVDPATNDVLLYDDSTQPQAQSSMISLATGQLLWSQSSNTPSLLPITVHDGILYGLEADQNSGTQVNVAVSEATGSFSSQEYALSPVGFTPAGDGVFIQDGSADDSEAILIGVCNPTSNG
jgi:hypothetical protein